MAETAHRPRVVVLSYSPIARDPRVLRQVRLFSSFADVVTVGYGPTPDGVVEHVEIPESVRPWRTKRLRAPVLFALRWWSRLYFGSPRVKFVQQAVAAGSMDVVVANDELAVPVALTLRPRGGVHADLHEYSPRVGEDRPGWRRRVAPFMRWAVRQVRKADTVTTVAPGLAKEYQREFGLNCAVVPNAAQYRDDLAPTAVPEPIRLVHIGIAGRARKLENMIDGVALLEQRRPGAFTLDIIVAPGEADYIEELKAHAADVAPQSARVLPPVPYNQMVDTLAAYDMGVFISPATTFNLEHALPNKFFEYVQARLAVLVGPSPEMGPYVREHGFGVIAEGFTAEFMADVLEDLTPTEVSELKVAADQAAQTLSADVMSQPWISAVQRLIVRAQPGWTAPGPEHAPAQ